VVVVLGGWQLGSSVEIKSGAPAEFQQQFKRLNNEHISKEASVTAAAAALPAFKHYFLWTLRHF